MYGPVVEEGMLRIIRTKQEMQALYKGSDIVPDIKKRSLKWTGQLVRMAHGRVVA
jgi:hypothetical protein